MNILSKISYKITSFFTRKEFIKVVDKFDHRFVVFRHNEKFRKKLLSKDRSNFVYYVTLKEKKKILGITFWSFYNTGSFWGDDDTYKLLIQNGMDDIFFYNVSAGSYTPSFIVGSEDYDEGVELILKYKISQQLGFNKSDSRVKENTDIIESHYKSYTRESRLSSLLDR